MQAAQDNDVLFYPILAGNEATSWLEFKDKYLNLFINNQFDNTIQEHVIQQFYNNFDQKRSMITMARVDLKAKPYFLNDEQIQWVEETLSHLTDEEKQDNYSFNLFSLEEDGDFNDSEYTNKDILNRYHIGGARYQGGNKQQVQALLNDLQQHSKVPLLVAANCDSGGNGACKDGTYIASAAQCEAAQDSKVAYNAGYVSGRESQALGVNINFDPCVDILKIGVTQL